jgi:hypothetical protein
VVPSPKETKSFHIGGGLGNREGVAAPPNQRPVARSGIVLEENDIMFQQFWLFPVDGRSYLVMKCFILCTISGGMKQQKMARHKALKGMSCIRVS